MKQLCITLLLCCFFTFHVRAQSVAQARCDRMGKGINLSNWLEAYWQQNWPNPNTYSKDFLIEIKKSGIRSIRLPINFAAITDDNYPYNVDTAHVVFSLVDSVISWAEELDMMLLIDNHHGWPLHDTLWRPQMPRMANLWAVLAKRYKDLDPEQYVFELLNEPPIPLSNDSLHVIYNACIDSIRTYAPDHSVVASPAFAGIGLGFVGFEPLADTNIIYTFHTYDPYPFTHQGFSWSDPYYAPGATFPGGQYDFLFGASWSMAEYWMNTYNLPVFLGEFGAGVHADMQSRCNWMDSVGIRIHRNRLPWFYWDVQYDFQMFKGAVIHQDSILPCFRQALRLYDDSTSTYSITETTETPDFDLYPNPATDYFLCRVKGEAKANFYVIDNTGRNIHSGTFTGKARIDVSNWPKGIYYVKVQASGFASVRKMVVN